MELSDLRDIYTRSPIIERDLFSPSGGPVEPDYPTEAPVLPAGVFGLTFQVDAALWVKIRSALEFGAAVQYEDEYFHLIAALNRAEQSIGQTGGGPVDYPNQAVLFHAGSQPGNLAPHEPNRIPDPGIGGYESLIHPFGHVVWNTSPVQGDWFEQSFYLAAGEYDFRVLGLNDPVAGIVEWRLDGTALGQQDWYAPTTEANIWKTIQPVVVASGGLHTLRGTMIDTNPASGDYWQTFTAFVFRARYTP